MNLSQLLAVLKRRKWIILLTTVVAAIIAGLASSLISPLFAATATVRVATSTAGRVEYADYIYAERLMNTYAQTILSRPILDQIAADLNLTTLPEVTVDVVRDTELLRITAEGPDPAIAQAVANALADVLKTQSQALYTGSTKSPRDILGELVARTESELAQARAERDQLLAARADESDNVRLESLNSTIQLKEQTLALLLTQYESAQLTEAVRANAVSIIEPAELPLDPSKPNKKINVLLGTLSGLLAGLGLALFIENADSTLHSTDDIRATADLPVLGRIPAVKRRGRANGLLPFTEGASIESEAYRGLRTNLLAAGSEHKLKSLLITSADRGEGKSTVIANLALTFAKAGRRVALIDADLRLPVQHTLFGLPNSAGLSNVLRQTCPVEAVMQNGQAPGLYVITSGPEPENPTELLDSDAMRAVIRQLAADYDVLLIDTPCLLSITDAAVLGPMADAVLLLVSCGQTRREEVGAALRQLADVKANTLGIIANRAEHSHRYNYYYSNHRRWPLAKPR